MKTRQLYAAEVLSFIFKYCGDVNTVRAVFNHDPVPEQLKTLCQMTLSLKLFSRSMEMQDRKLHEVLPIVQETMRQFQILYHVVGNENHSILDLITSNFLARVKTNSFLAITTA
jgi:hypothetical protein